MEQQGKVMPKGCLRLGKRSILEESISRLLAEGIERIVIVTGHLKEQFEPLEDRYPQTVQLVHNPHFADSGTMYSLYCARHHIDADFLLLEADIVYERRALATCLKSPDDNVVVLAGFSNTHDECFVETRNGRLVGISKDRRSLGSEVTGEMIGICKISHALFSVMLDTADDRFRETRHLDYEMDWLVSAARHVFISCLVIEDLMWCEIDDQAHLIYALNEVYPGVRQRDLDTDECDGQRVQSDLSKFKTIGFFDERDIIVRHILDLFTTVNEHKIRACIMFGTLLGKLRHDDFIPWNDNVDIVIFDFGAFLEHCVPDLERQGYTIEPDVRGGKRMGCHIFREDGAKVPGKPRLRFPWIGIWEHEAGEDGLVVLPPEDIRYRLEDFLPLGETNFLGIPVGVPHDPTAILNTYFDSETWMEFCQLPYRDHRNGGKLTGFSDDKFKVQTVLDYLAAEAEPLPQRGGPGMMLEDPDRWKFPALAKPESDGAFCYHIQRRISVWFSVRLARHIGPNAATGLDLIFGVAAAALVLMGYWLWGVVLIQMFGIFSCVDGEIARIRGRASRIGDFLDTLTDRVTEVLLVAAIAISLCGRVDPVSALSAGLALLGAVFMLTTSSEKFRSAWQMGYPKRKLERLFSLFCAGSEGRLLILSLGLVVGDLTENSSIMLWLLWGLAGAVSLNFLVRIGLVCRHFKDGERPGS